jgi:peptidoglycan/xylan/chitin deacetylase (PgdA/CDA1 family)
MSGRRERIAWVAGAVGLTRIMEYVARRPSLLVLNYHRIGDPKNGEYDPALFSATAEQFNTQVRFLKNRYRLVSLDEALEVLTKGSAEPSILVTFDDGYADNYHIAYPVLKSHATCGTFFLPTGFIGANRVPWWDAIAFMLRHSRRRIVTLAEPASISVDLAKFRPALRAVLRAYKLPSMRDPARFLSQLSEATGIDPPESFQRPLFMSWEQAREMAAGGMDLGSHTHTHQILGKLTFEEQVAELAQSKEMIREKTGVAPVSVSYPVGKPGTFTADTFTALEATGYRAGFSFYGGINIPRHTSLCDIKRIPVDFDHSLARIRSTVSGMIATAPQ